MTAPVAMLIGRALRCLLVASILFSASAIAGNRSSDFALTTLAGLREEVVLSGAVIHGNRLDMSRFRDTRSAPMLLDEVRRIWSQRPAPIEVVAHDGWFTMTQAVGATIESFEVRPAGPGAEGRRIRWHRNASRPTDDLKWLEQALPSGSRVLERVSHRDGGRQMTTLVALSTKDVRIAGLALASALKQNGFGNGPLRMPSFPDGGMVFFMARGPEEIAVTISEHEGQRAIVMHWGRAMQ